MDKKLEKLQEIIGYQFQRPGLLAHALTHSSYANERHWDKTRCNERLEFLGDAVLELVSSNFLYHQFPDMPEGEMTKLRASLVCEPTLAYCAEEIPLGDYLYLGKGEDQTGGRKRPSVVSDAMEAVIGAIFLDGGLANAKEFICRFVLNDIEHKKLFYDSKTILQEIVQREYGAVLHYVMVSEEGPEHDKQYTMQAMIGQRPGGIGTGRTKKAAQQMAAYQTIRSLKKR